MVELEFVDKVEAAKARKLVYARSAYRHEPDFWTSSIQRIGELLDARDALADSLAASVARGNDGDDLKSAAGEFYGAVRQLLRLTAAGNTTESFLSDTMAPLLRGRERVYGELRRDLFGS